MTPSTIASAQKAAGITSGGPGKRFDDIVATQIDLDLDL
jgi:hypothetical protein